MQIEQLEHMLARGRDDALVRFSLGNAYLQADDAATAAVHFRAAVAHKPDYSAAWKLLGKALDAAGEPAAAMEAFTSGIDAAERHGNLQAAKEMTVFRRRIQKRSQ